MKYIITPNSVVLYTDTKTHIILRSDTAHFDGIVNALNSGDLEKALSLADIEQGLKNFIMGAITIKDEIVYYNDEPLNNVMSVRLLHLFKSGHDCAPFVAFMENTLKNVSKRSIDELYKFLEHKNLPITESGTFLAYKAVQNDWKDKYSASIDNSVGASPRMPRSKVDDNANHACSSGYHVGSLEYVSGFASGYGSEDGDRIVIVEVNPADVVSIPYDSNCQKVRCCSYKVVGVYTGPLPDYYTPSFDWDDECKEESYKGEWEEEESYEDPW